MSAQGLELALVLIVVETTDVIFAVDSIPAVLAVTRQPYVVFTSNIFAVLGLRSMYFALAGLMELFHLLNNFSWVNIVMFKIMADRFDFPREKVVQNFQN